MRFSALVRTSHELEGHGNAVLAIVGHVCGIAFERSSGGGGGYGGVVVSRW